MDSSKYDELIEDTLKVKDDIDRRMYLSDGADAGIMAAILVASQHSNEDLGQLAGFIQKR